MNFEIFQLMVVLAVVLSIIAVVILLRDVNKLPYRGKPKHIDWDAVNHPAVKSLLPNSYNQEAAAEAYQQLTGVSLEEAKVVIAYVVANWNNLDDLSDIDD